MLKVLRIKSIAKYWHLYNFLLLLSINFTYACNNRLVTMFCLSVHGHGISNDGNGLFDVLEQNLYILGRQVIEVCIFDGV